MLSKKSCRKVWWFQFYFLLLPPTSVNCLYGERRKCSMFRLSLFMEKRSFALFLTDRNLENFNHSRNLATMDAHASSLYQAILLRTLLVCLFSRYVYESYKDYCIYSLLRGFCVACSTMMGIPGPLSVEHGNVRFHASFIYRFT